MSVTADYLIKAMSAAGDRGAHQIAHSILSSPSPVPRPSAHSFANPVSFRELSGLVGHANSIEQGGFRFLDVLCFFVIGFLLWFIWKSCKARSEQNKMN